MQNAIRTTAQLAEFFTYGPREFAALDRQIVLIGQGKKFEVWDETAWAARRDRWLAEDMADYRELSDDMRKLSL